MQKMTSNNGHHEASKENLDLQENGAASESSDVILFHKPNIPSEDNETVGSDHLIPKITLTPIADVIQTRSNSVAFETKMDSTSRTESSRTNSGTVQKSIHSLSNIELLMSVEEVKKRAKYLELENTVFIHFLEKNDPTLLAEMEGMLKQVQITQERASIASKRLTLSRLSRRESILPVTSSLTGSVLIDKDAPRINLTQKTDLVIKEMETTTEACQKVARKCYLKRHKLKAELEEMGMRDSQIREAFNVFDGVFITGVMIEKYAQKNIAEKLFRFMEETLKQARLIVDKIRLRSSSLKVQYHKICNQLSQKQEIGENLEEVDFEQLRIENEHLIEKIDQRNLLLLELKRMNGQANLLLSQTKKQLLKKMETLKNIQDNISSTEDKTRKLDLECDQVNKQLDRIKGEFDQIKQRTETYRVPSVMDYVKKKAELNTLKKNFKVWTRRKQIKELALLAALREMKNAAGSYVTKTVWLQHPRDTQAGRDSMQSTFEFRFEKIRRLAMERKRSRVSGRKQNI